LLAVVVVVVLLWEVGVGGLVVLAVIVLRGVGVLAVVVVAAVVVLPVVVVVAVVVLAVVVVVLAIAVVVLAVVEMKVQDREVQRSSKPHVYTARCLTPQAVAMLLLTQWPQDTSTRSPNKVVFMSCLEPEDQKQNVTELLKSQHTRGDY